MPTGAETLGDGAYAASGNHMRVRIEKGAPAGTIAAPPSKSYAHRMLICAALAAYGAPTGETSMIHGIGAADDISEDILATMDCIRALGIECEAVGDGIRVAGDTAGRNRDRRQATERETGKEAVRQDAARQDAAGRQLPLPVLHCRESGSTLRFFIPIAMALAGGGIFTGSGRLMQRGIDVYEELFADCCDTAGSGVRGSTAGVSITKEPGRITVCGTLRAGEMSVRGDMSSQFISGLLYALPLLDEDSILHVREPVESRQYIDITTDVMKMYGVTVEETASNTFYIRGGQRYMPGHRSVEGDWSNAAFLYAMKYLHEGAGALADDDGIGTDTGIYADTYIDTYIDTNIDTDIATDTGITPGTVSGENSAVWAISGREDGWRGGLKICGLNSDSIQADKICVEYFHRLRGMNMADERTDRHSEQACRNTDMLCGCTTKDESARYNAFTEDIITLDISDCPDLGPVLFAYAAATGGARFTGVRRLRIKESDRIACMQEELRKFGIETHSGEDDLIVCQGQMHRPGEVLCAHGDHRIAMALAVLCTLTGGEIEGAEAVAKSWPRFWTVLRTLGISVSVTA